MPERTIDLLFRLLQQNDGKFSKRAREKEFSALTAAEAAHIQSLYERAFMGQKSPPVGRFQQYFRGLR